MTQFKLEVAVIPVSDMDLARLLRIGGSSAPDVYERPPVATDYDVLRSEPSGSKTACVDTLPPETHCRTPLRPISP